MREELLKGLTEEQINKIKECKNQDEILRLAKDEGVELTDDQLEAVNGGGCLGSAPSCPYCGADKENVYCGKNPDRIFSGTKVWICKVCGQYWSMS